MTIAHPILRRSGWFSPAGLPCYSKVGGPRPFFSQVLTGFARDAKDSFQSAQTAAFFRSLENLFLRVGAIALRRLPTTVLTSMTPVPLFTIARVSIMHKLFTNAVAAYQSDSDHIFDYALSHPIAPLPLRKSSYKYYA